ncbi:MAG: hypothetical protein AVO38_02025, partial [delta proteobacterium ML8_D]
DFSLMLHDVISPTRPYTLISQGVGVSLTLTQRVRGRRQIDGCIKSCVPSNSEFFNELISRSLSNRRHEDSSGKPPLEKACPVLALLA